jgi:hypothetical protein
MGFDDEGDLRAGRIEEAVETEENGMDLAETTEEFVRNLEKNSASSIQKEAASTLATATGMKMRRRKMRRSKKKTNWG